ncbi:MAG TPA: histidine kinase dimerization/phosphoacceptor domain -containing protein, partial [Polyangiaceae bacterium]
LRNLFSAGDFLPHGHCYLWQPEVVWLHVISDSLIALAYLSIPVTLGYFVRRRHDLPFAWVFRAFALFIISCGTTHAMEVLTLWTPLYWLSGSIKLVTATASVSTAVLLVPLVPRALALPSPSELRRAHENLRRTEARFRAATEGMRDAFYILESVRDASGAIVDFRLAEMNEAARRWLGLDAASSSGALYSEVARPPQAMAHDAIVKALEAKGLVEQERKIAESLDGTRWVREQLVALDDGLAITVREITDDRRHQEVLELHSAIVRNMSEGVCVARATDRRIVYANPKFESMLGYRPGELDDQICRIFESVDAMGRAHDLQPLVREQLERDGTASHEATSLKKDGTSIICRTTTASLSHPDHGEAWVAVAEDITARKSAEKAVADSLHEKEVLLREIHHRVKNNLQIISSLLKLHAERITDPIARGVFRDSQERVRSIALLHEKLYQSGNLGGVDIAHYAASLVQAILRAQGHGAGATRVTIDATGIYLPVGAALPCGLILNELITNSLKHAFAEEQVDAREIRVRMAAQGDEIELSVEDNGVGLPSSFDLNGVGTLGMRLVRMFAHQLGGEVQFTREIGTRWSIRFPRGADLEG